MLLFCYQLLPSHIVNKYLNTKTVINERVKRCVSRLTPVLPKTFEARPNFCLLFCMLHANDGPASRLQPRIVSSLLNSNCSPSLDTNMSVGACLLALSLQYNIYSIIKNTQMCSKEVLKEFESTTFQTAGVYFTTSTQGFNDSFISRLALYGF